MNKIFENPNDYFNSLTDNEFLSLLDEFNIEYDVVETVKNSDDIKCDITQNIAKIESLMNKGKKFNTLNNFAISEFKINANSCSLSTVSNLAIGEFKTEKRDRQDSEYKDDFRKAA